MSPAATPKAKIELKFDDNRKLPLLYGAHDQNLARIERQLGVSIASRGNLLTLSGQPRALEQARDALGSLWERLERDLPVEAGDIDAAVRLAATPLPTPSEPGPPTIRTRRRTLSARSALQGQYLEMMDRCELVFALGPAGTGKTYLAVAHAVTMLLAGRIERLVLSRPAVEAGERLGFLPGDMREKVDPYMRPIYDALTDFLPRDQVERRIASGEIEIAPLAFMRGRTLAHAFVILDEAQNTTPPQMKMALTRLGEGSRMIVTGDLSQVDLAPGLRSGLADALDVLGREEVPQIGIVRFTQADVVRHPLVARIVQAYERRDAAG